MSKVPKMKYVSSIQKTFAIIIKVFEICFSVPRISARLSENIFLLIFFKICPYKSIAFCRNQNGLESVGVRQRLAVDIMDTDDVIQIQTAWGR